MRKKQAAVVVLAVLVLLGSYSESVFAQAKAKKRASSATGAVSSTRAKDLGAKAQIIYTVDSNNPPEMTSGDAQRVLLEVLNRTYQFGDSYTHFSLLDGKINYRRHIGNYSIEYHSLPLDSISADAYSSDFRKVGPMYYVKSPHYCSETILRTLTSKHGNVYLNDHVLAWDKIEDIQKFLQAVYVLKQAKEGKEVFNYLVRGNKRLAALDNEGARADAIAYLQENPKVGLFFNEDNIMSIYDICDVPDCQNRIESDLLAADIAQKNDDVAGAFNSYFRAYALMANNNPKMQAAKGNLVQLYPKLKEKPGLPEVCRRLRVQSEAVIKEGNYRDGLWRLEELLKFVPWWPQGHYNSALLSAQVNDYQNAIEHMKVYLILDPGSSNAISGQDKIYEWEMKVKK